MLVNHYHTQLIILRACMRISRCPSSPFLFFPLLFLMPLVLLHHILVDTLAVRRQNLPFMCSPAGSETPVSQEARRAICHRPSEQMIKLASQLCILPLDMDGQSNKDPTQLSYSTFKVHTFICTERECDLCEGGFETHQVFV